MRIYITSLSVAMRRTLMWSTNCLTDREYEPYDIRRQDVSLYHDPLSGMRYFFGVFPLEQGPLTSSI